MKFVSFASIWRLSAGLAFLTALGFWQLCTPVRASATTPHVATGRIVEVVPEKREIYVLPTSPVTGETEIRKLEYYFTADTRLLSAGKEADFRDLQEGMTVTVTSRKIGKRLDPLQVEIVGAD